jgi:hypothetical protein
MDESCHCKNCGHYLWSEGEGLCQPCQNQEEMSDEAAEVSA